MCRQPGDIVEPLDSIRKLRILRSVNTVFIELPAFERHREQYLDDDGFRQLQVALMVNPTAGDPIEGTGGPEFWLFTLYDKGEMADLTARQRAALKELVKTELGTRRR
jgi:hypothetical protein